MYVLQREQRVTTVSGTTGISVCNRKKRPVLVLVLVDVMLLALELTFCTLSLRYGCKTRPNASLDFFSRALLKGNALTVE